MKDLTQRFIETRQFLEELEATHLRDLSELYEPMSDKKIDEIKLTGFCNWELLTSILIKLKPEIRKK